MGNPEVSAMAASATAESGRGATKGTRRHVIGAVLVVLVLVALIVAVASWRKNPNLIGISGEGVDPIGVPLAQAAYAINIADPVPNHGTETITLKSATVHLATNTAGATATLAICVSRVGRQIGGVLPSQVSDYCSRVIPIQPGTEMLCAGSGPPKEYIVLTVIATKTGLVRADRLRITYERGWQHLYQRGSLDSSLAVGVRVVPPNAT